MGATRSKSFAERIADVLIEEGLLLPNQLEEAVAIQQKEGGRLLKILTDRQFVTDQDMTVSMGRCLNTPLINLPKVRIPEDVLSLVPRDMAKANKLVPIARLNGKLFVAMADPTNVLAVDDVKRRVHLEIVPMIATEKAVNDASREFITRLTLIRFSSRLPKTPPSPAKWRCNQPSPTKSIWIV